MATTDGGRWTTPATVAGPGVAATIAVAALVAAQVIGKATRDALFLSHFSPTRLPIVMIASMVLSGGVVTVLTRLISRFGPAFVAPRLFAVHAALLASEWLLAQRYETATATIVYVHTAAFGAPILSAFWSLVSERFDPHAAKRAIGRLGAGAALGGLVGGGVAWGGSRIAPVPALLLTGAALSLVSVWGVQELAHDARGKPLESTPASPSPSTFGALRDAPYLQRLCAVVALGALLQALLDFTLGAQAKSTYGSGARLLSFFALFQIVVGVASFVLQTAASRPALDRLGIGGTVALLPAAVAGLGVAALGAPGLITTALQRAADGALRASLFRSAYEVLFTPVPQSLKRPLKTVIDVSFDRLGGLVGSGVTLALIGLWPALALRTITAASVLVALLQILVAYSLHRGYVSTLAEGLRSGAIQLDAASIADATTRRTLSRTLSNLDRRTLLARIEEAWIAKAGADDSAAVENARGAEGTPRPEALARAYDDPVRAMVALRSGDGATVRAALRGSMAHVRLLAPQILDLLSRDDLARDVMGALAPSSASIVGAILDAVLDEGRPARVRRRAARLLRGVPTQRVVDGVVHGLDAKALDVRYACGRVLVALREQNPALRFDGAAMFALAKRELQGAADDPRSLEHAFDILSLTAAQEPLQLAYGALQSADPFLRGLALEYLDATLPHDMRAVMMLRLSNPPPPASSPRPSQRSLDGLLKSREAIRVHLDELRRSRDPDA
jgi:hypothetical protein